MTATYHTIVAYEMVWQWYYDELGNKHVRELLGKQAIAFILEQDYVYAIPVDSITALISREKELPDSIGKRNEHQND